MYVDAERVERLSALLKYAMSEEKAREAAASLVGRYVTDVAAFEAGARQLSADGLLSERAAQLLQLVPELTRLIERQRLGDKPRLDSFARASAFFAVKYIGARYERFCLACLDKKFRLIRCEELTRGSLRTVMIYPRLALELALETGASYSVCSHNHPGNTGEFTAGDAMATRRLLQVFNSVGIPLLDHVLVCGQSAVSMRKRRALPESEWLKLGDKTLPRDKWLTES